MAADPPHTAELRPPGDPVPDFIERELARMDELETAPDSLL